MFIKIITNRIALVIIKITVGSIREEKIMLKFTLTRTTVTCHAISSSRNTIALFNSFWYTSKKAKIPKINWEPPKIPL